MQVWVLLLLLLFKLKKLEWIYRLKGKSQKRGRGETAGKGEVFNGSGTLKLQELT